MMLKPLSPWLFCVAPMMDWTDRHCRYFYRQLSSHARLYTEMVTANAIIHGDRDKLLGFSQCEHPIALQLGGSDPLAMAQATKIGADYGYDEININCGCPSDRVQNGYFGAALMADPQRVAHCIKAMKQSVSIPVTVKCRIGIDDQDCLQSLDRFIEAIIGEGVDAVIIHARKAWLKGLSPKDNRDIPPLDYNRVYALKERFPETPMILNGGLNDLDAAKHAQNNLDGVMLGRAIYQKPELLSQVDALFFSDDKVEQNLTDIVAFMQDYAERHVKAGGRYHHITRHMIGLFQGKKGAKKWRQTLSEKMRCDAANWDDLKAAIPENTYEVA